MNRTIVAALACLSVAGILSCTRKEPAKQPSTPGSAEDAALQAPEIPIDVMPKLLDSPVTYPEEARNRGEAGIVYVKALVGKDGHVTLATIDPKEPASQFLAQAAVEAVKQWRFEPAKSKGEPVEIWIVVPVNFKLH